MRQVYSVLNEETGQRDWVETTSPPIAMVTIDTADRQAYEKYIDNIVDNPINLQKFVDRCYRAEKDDFQKRLFQLMMDYQPDSNDEVCYLPTLRLG